MPDPSDPNPAPRCKYVVINLPRSAARRAHMERELKKAGIDDEAEFFSAIDGYGLQATAESRRETRRRARGLRYVWPKSMIWTDVACLLSHKAVWERLLQDDSCDAYVVLEDNALLAPGFGAAARALAADKNIDFLLLQVRRGLKESQAAFVRSLPGGFELAAEHGPHPEAKLVGRNARSTTEILRYWLLGTKGYFVSKEGARKLAARNAKIRRPVDHTLSRFWEYDLPPLVTCPNLVSFSLEYESDAIDPESPYILPKFPSRDPRRFAARALGALVRRRDVVRYRRAIRRLRKTYGPADRSLPVNFNPLKTGPEYLAALVPEPWERRRGGPGKAPP